MSFPSIAYPEDARVLPKGRSRFSMTMVASAGIDSQYNGSGDVESIAGRYSMQLNAGNLSRIAPALRPLVGMLNNSAPNAGNALDAGYLDLGATAYRQQFVFVEQYGLTDRLSVGIQVPVIRGQINVTKNLTGTNNARSLSDQYVPDSATDAKDGLRTVADVSIPMLEAELAKLGYAPVASSDKSGLGDIAFGGRYAYRQDERVVGSVQLGMTAPTGATPKPNELVAMPFGEGAWDVGAAHLFQWSPAPWLILGQGIHYTYKLANTQRARVPDDSSDVLPGPDSEREVRRKLGDKAFATLSLDWKPSTELMFGTQYEWYWRMRDRFYELAGPATGRELEAMASGIHYTETLSFQFTYSTIDLFLKGKFPVPANVLLSYNHTTRGKNSPVARYATAELAMFF
jgi:hypothetical protein